MDAWMALRSVTKRDTLAKQLSLQLLDYPSSSLLVSTTHCMPSNSPPLHHLHPIEIGTKITKQDSRHLPIGGLCGGPGSALELIWLTCNAFRDHI